MKKIYFLILLKILVIKASKNSELENEFRKKKIFFSDSSKINIKITPTKELENLKIPLNLSENENLIKITEKIKEKNEASCNFSEISQLIKKIGPSLKIKNAEYIKYDKKNKLLIIYEKKIHLYKLEPIKKNSNYLKWQEMENIFDEINFDNFEILNENFFEYKNIEINSDDFIRNFGVFFWNNNIFFFDFFENKIIFQTEIKIEISENNKIFFLKNFGEDIFKLNFFIYESNEDTIYIYEFDLNKKILNLFQKFDLKSFFKKSSLLKKNNFRVFCEYKPQMEINVIYAISEKKGLIKFKENLEKNIFEYEKKNLQFIEGEIAKINSKRVFIIDKFKNNSKMVIYRPFRFNTNLKIEMEIFFDFKIKNIFLDKKKILIENYKNDFYLYNFEIYEKIKQNSLLNNFLDKKILLTKIEFEENENKKKILDIIENLFLVKIIKEKEINLNFYEKNKKLLNINCSINNNETNLFIVQYNIFIANLENEFTNQKKIFEIKLEKKRYSFKYIIGCFVFIVIMLLLISVSLLFCIFLICPKRKNTFYKANSNHDLITY